MRYVFVGAIVLFTAAFHIGAAAEQAADRPLSRSLTVEQIAVYDVRPPVRPATAGDDGLEVLAWVDRPDYTYATGEDVQSVRRDQQGRLHYRPQRRPGRGDDRPVS